MLCYGCFQERPGDAGPCPHCGATGLLPEYSNALPPGSVLAGRWQVGYPLGQGGFGITYIARELASGERVAVKELYPFRLAIREPGTTRIRPVQQAREEEYARVLRQFRREAQVLALFRGRPDVVQISHWFEENGTAYYVMEYLDGESLKQYMKRVGRLPWRQALALLEPVFHALDAVHREGIVHRDVSPDNIYLCRDGSVKLLDFGAARDKIAESEEQDIILRPGYVPMEQYRSTGRLGPWTDVYALSAVLYQAVTGNEPPDAVSRYEKDRLAPPSALGVSLPRQAERALLRGLALEIGDRWQSIEELRQGLLEQIAVPLSPEERRQEEARRAAEEQARRDEEARQAEARSQLLEQQARQMKKKGRRPVLLAVAAGILVPALLLAGAVALYAWLSPAYSAEVRALTVADGVPALAGAERTKELLAAGADGSAEAGNASGNLANGGGMTREGLVALDGERSLNLYGGRLYYLDLLGKDVWCFDGSKTRCILEWEEELDSLLAGPEGLLFTATVEGVRAVYHSRWTEDGEPGSPVRLADCDLLSVPVLADGAVYYNDPEGGLARCLLATGAVETLLPADQYAHLSFAMDGCLYGLCSRTEQLEQEPYVRFFETVWRYDLSDGRFEELPVRETDISNLNGRAGRLYFLVNEEGGSTLVRYDLAEGVQETIYAPETAARLYGGELAQVDGVTLIHLQEGNRFEAILVDESGRRWSLEELEANG